MTHVEFPAEIPIATERKSGVARLSGWRRVVLHVAVWHLLAIVVGAALGAGLQLRRWTWEMTDPIHFTSDINRGYNWGREAAERGYFNLYEKMAAQESGWDNWLDYAPLRLAVMTGWANFTRAHAADASRWQADWSFNKFILLFNTGMELLGAVCAFLLVRLWLVRAAGAWSPFDRVPRAQSPATVAPFTGWVAGLMAAMLFWFNPAIHLSAHGWPTWDMWIMPMYLLAILLASYNWWFAAGLTVAVGAMFKGQQFTVAPVFVLWALMLWRFDAVLKWAAGLMFGIGALASVWLLSYVPAEALDAMRTQQAAARRPWVVKDFALPDRVLDVPAVAWVASLALFAIAAPLILSRFARAKAVAEIVDAPRASEDVPVRLRSRPTSLRAAGAMLARHRPVLPMVALGLIGLALAWWPWLLPANRNLARTGLLFAIAVVIGLLFVRPRHVAYLTAGVLGASLLLCPTLFNGSDAWWICGWKYGTFHWPWLYMGTTSNLPGLLVNRFDWEHRNTAALVSQLPADVLWGWPRFAIDVTIKQLLAAVYAVTLALCGIGIGLQARRRDPRILVAFTAPWLMFFCFPVQIHERYLLYAAGVAAITIGAGVGPALIGVLLSAFTWIMTIHVMFAGSGRRGGPGIFGHLLADEFPALFAPTIGRSLHEFVEKTHPDIAWAILLCAAIYLYLAIAPSRRRQRKKATTEITDVTD